MNMRAYQVLDTSTPPSLVSIEKPSPKGNEVLLKVEACGLNFADLLMCKGTYQDTPETPFTLGLEVCGTIEALGPEAKGISIGTRVAVYAGQGGMADYAVYPIDLCRPVPASMTSEEAAGFMIAYGTSHLALTRRARLSRGETLLVLGAAGGVGLTAVEIGKLMGARVIAVARGPEKLQIARDAGADIAIDASADLTKELRELGGVDVVYDAVGGDAFKQVLRACNREARYLAIGFASGEVPQIPANHLLVKNIDVIGFYWGGYLKFAPEVLFASLSELMDWHAKGLLKPHISHVIPLDRADEALELLRSRKSTGKVVVKP